jgi:hypothetical protein
MLIEREIAERPLPLPFLRPAPGRLPPWLGDFILWFGGAGIEPAPGWVVGCSPRWALFGGSESSKCALLSDGERSAIIGLPVLQCAFADIQQGGCLGLI